MTKDGLNPDENIKIKKAGTPLRGYQPKESITTAPPVTPPLPTKGSSAAPPKTETDSLKAMQQFADAFTRFSASFEKLSESFNKIAELHKEKEKTNADNIHENQL